MGSHHFGARGTGLEGLVLRAERPLLSFLIPLGPSSWTRVFTSLGDTALCVGGQ